MQTFAYSLYSGIGSFNTKNFVFEPNCGYTESYALSPSGFITAESSSSEITFESNDWDDVGTYTYHNTVTFSDYPSEYVSSPFSHEIEFVLEITDD